MTDIITSRTVDEKYSATYCTFWPKYERPTVILENYIQSKYMKNTNLFLLCL